jgi:hypothetical protein
LFHESNGEDTCTENGEGETYQVDIGGKDNFDMESNLIENVHLDTVNMHISETASKLA